MATNSTDDTAAGAISGRSTEPPLNESRPRPTADPASENSKPSPECRALTCKEQRFLEEYVACGRNGTLAYRRLYPKANYNTARTGARAILTKPYIRDHLLATHGALRRQLFSNVQRVLDEWGKIAYADLGDVIDFSKNPPELRPGKDMPPAARQAIASIEITPIPQKSKGKKGAKQKPLTRIRVRMIDKRGALDKISQHLGFYDEMPALERILSGLPMGLARQIREGFQREIEAAKRGNQNPESDRVVDGAKDEMDSIPVVSKMPLSLRESSELPHVSSTGTVDGLSNSGISSLFDDP